MLGCNGEEAAYFDETVYRVADQKEQEGVWLGEQTLGIPQC